MAEGPGTIGRWSAEELRSQRANRDDVLVVDVRTMDARSLSPAQIPGSEWIPLAAITQRARTLPRDATIVTYCT